MSRCDLLHIITKLELGGAQTQLFNLISGLHKNGYKICLASAAGILTPDFNSLKGVSVKRTRFLARPLNPFNDFLALVELLFRIMFSRPDVVHTHSSKAGILGRIAAQLAGVPVIVHTVHGWSFNDYQPKAIRKLFILLERFCAGFTDVIIVVSRDGAEKGLAASIGSSSQYSLIRYGIEPSIYRRFKRGGEDREYLSAALGVNFTGKVVGMVGCFKPQKSPLDFIKVAGMVLRKLPGTKFVLIGDGRLRWRIEQEIQSSALQESVILAGWRRDVPDLLAGMDVFVLTSLWEGLPVSVLEALRSGLPVVATDTGGIRDVVQDGVNGFLVKCGDTGSLSSRVEELLLNDALRERFSAAAGNCIGDDYSLKHMVAKTQLLYSAILKRKKDMHASGN
jgi:glycosyltransferase involved in cell wall biosynthesis